MEAAGGTQSSSQMVADEGGKQLDEGPLGRLVTEIGRAVRAGWSQTARLITLLAVAAAAVALIIRTSK